MRTGAPAGHRGFFHETVLYSSDEEFLGFVVPFLEQGVAAGEPVLVALGPRTTGLVQDAVGTRSGLSYIHEDDRYGRPAEVIRSYRQIFAELVAAGAPQIRVVGEIPHPGLGQPWDWWARYEAAINTTFAEFPVWGVCPYDLRITPATVLEDAGHTHPHLATVDGAHLANPRFREPAEFLDRRRTAPSDALEASVPAVDLRDPTPTAARHAVRDTAETTRLDEERVEGMVLAVSEAVTNALCHGVPPVRMRLWTTPARMLAAVADRGPGPADPLAGLLPTTDSSSGGLGLWMSHRVCDAVSLDREEDGFTIRLVVGTPVDGTAGHV